MVVCGNFTHLECWNLAVQEDASKIKLDLETNCKEYIVSTSMSNSSKFAGCFTVDVGTIYGRRPPQGEATITADC